MKASWHNNPKHDEPINYSREIPKAKRTVREETYTMYLLRLCNRSQHPLIISSGWLAQNDLVPHHGDVDWLESLTGRWNCCCINISEDKFVNRKHVFLFKLFIFECCGVRCWDSSYKHEFINWSLYQYEYRMEPTIALCWCLNALSIELFKRNSAAIQRTSTL